MQIPLPKTLPRVLFLNSPEFASHEQVESIHKIANVTVIAQCVREEQLPIIRAAIETSGPFIAWVWFHRWGEPSPVPLDEELLKPVVETGCKLISMGGAGYDRVDISYLTEKGVTYANNPLSVGWRTAQHSVLLTLMAIKGVIQHDAGVRAGKWLDKSIPSNQTRGTVVGIVGMGHIGAQVAKHLQQFGMKIIYTKRTRLPEEEEDGAVFVSFEELIAQADVISLNCPLTKETRHLLSDKEFEKMKDGVIIVNTSRGPVIHEDALVRALESGKVMRAALDVFEFEPEVHPALKSSPNTILTPHNAVLDSGIMRDQHAEILSNLESFLRTGKPNTPVN